MSSSSDGPSIQYKFTQQGLDDLTSRIKQLHEEFRNGQMTYTQYKSGIREATEQGKAATQEFSQMKGAIAAANPQLLEYTRTMSTFGSVANTVLGITNAINLAQMAGLGMDKQVADDKMQLAAATNQAAKDLAAFGPNSAQYQTDLQVKDAATNKLAYDQNQLAYQSVSTSATLAASAVSIAGSISQTIIGLKAMDAMMSPQLAENFAVALAGVGSAALTILAPIAIVVAAIEGIYYAYRALDPQFAQTTDQIYNSMLQNWHLDTLSATLLAPFVTFVIGLEGLGDQVENMFIALYNGIVSYFVNPLITAWDSTLGHITGSIQKLSPQNYVNQTLQQAMSEIGLGSATSSATPSNTGAGAINQMMLTGSLTGAANGPALQTAQAQLAQSMETGTTTSQILDSQRQAASSLSSVNPNLVTIYTHVDTLNDTVNTSATSITGAIHDLTTATLAAQKAQQDAVTSALQSIQQQQQSLPQQIAELNKQLQDAQKQRDAAQQNLNNVTAANMPFLNQFSPDNDPHFTAIQAAGGAVTSAQNNISSIQGQINSLQNQQQALKQQSQNIVAGAASQGILDVGNVGVQSVLSSMGLDSSTGIGSIIAGALGSYGGIGGAGINSQQLQQFASTGDYGIFTQAVLQDNASSAAETSPTNEYNQLVNSYLSMGFSSSQAQQYANAVKNNSNNFNGNVRSPNNNGGYGAGDKYLPLADGMDGIISTPTKLLVGEAGPESVSITPLSKGGGGGKGVSITINVQGSILSDQDFRNKVDQAIKSSLKGVGFT